MSTSPDERIARALKMARRSGQSPDMDPRLIIDQMVRALLGCDHMIMVPELGPYVHGFGTNDAYTDWVAETRNGEDGPETHTWDKGTLPDS